MGDLRSELTSIYRRHGELVPQTVVDEARPVDAPLHDRFEWDNLVAGEAWRRTQASELIRSVRMAYAERPDGSGEPKFVRAFASLHQAGEHTERGYAPVEEVLADDFRRKMLLRECERAIAELQHRYSHLEEFSALLRAAAG